MVVLLSRNSHGGAYGVSPINTPSECWQVRRSPGTVRLMCARISCRRCAAFHLQIIPSQLRQVSRCTDARLHFARRSLWEYPA